MARSGLGLGSFLPGDPRTQEPWRVDTQTVLRAGILGALALVLFALLLLRLWALQILSGDDFLQVARNNQIRTVRLQAPRGPILDRHGTVLVGNRLSRVVVVWPADLPQAGEQPNGYQVMKRLANVLHVPLRSLSRRVDERRKTDPLNPVVVKEDVGRFASSYILERADEFPGVEVSSRYVRTYPLGSLASHVLGYVGEASPDQIDRNPSEIYPGDIVGRAGAELSFDRELRGQAGLAQLRVDSAGHPRTDLETTKRAQPGYAIRLTIDAKLQRAAEDALWYGIVTAQNSQCRGCWAANGGAIVALDPRDGSVLASASYPTYPPSVYAGHVRTRVLAHWGLTKATAETANYPSINRVTSGLYPPGSTFKPLTAIAALQTGLIGPYQLLECTPSFEAAGQTFVNWDPYVNQAMDLPTALAASCDTYFYQLGARIYGLPKSYGSPLQEWASRFGFGQKTGVDVGLDEPGLLPTREWRIKHFTNAIDKLWKPGDSIQLAIGQKDLTATPLQMARFYAAIASGGKLVTPHFLRSIQQEDTTVGRAVSPSPEKINVSSFNLDAVREGLYRATHDANGTSEPVFGNFPIAIAGKTGTAEKYESQYKQNFNQSWWCGYGPTDNPRLVVCAVIENGGHGGEAAAPAARKVFETFFDVSGGTVSGAINSD